MNLTLDDIVTWAIVVFNLALALAFIIQGSHRRSPSTLIPPKRRRSVS